MKKTHRQLLVVLALVTALGVGRSVQGFATQEETKNGWLDGVVLKEDGSPTTSLITMQLLRDGKLTAMTVPNTMMGGLYSIRDLTPGVYELQVYDNYRAYRPERIWGVLVRPGVRSRLNIILQKGQQLEEISRPEVVSQPVIIVSEALAQLQYEIDSLRKK